MEREPDTAGHHLEHPSLAAHLNTIHRGDPTPTPPFPDPHPPGPSLLIGGTIRICPYCPAPHRGPIRAERETERDRQSVLRAWKSGYGNLCPGTPWCDSPGQPHPVAPDELTVDHRRAQATGGELSDGPAVMCSAADSRKM